MVRACRRCEPDFAALLAERDRDREQIDLLAAERDELHARLAACEGEREELRARLSEHERYRFGGRSERSEHDESDRSAPSDSEGAVAGGSSSGEEPHKRKRGEQPGRPSPRRRCYDHLGSEEVPHDFAEPLVCPRCQAPYVPFDEERYEEIHFEVRIVGRVHRCKRYRRTCCCHDACGILTAPSPPKPIKKGRLSIGFLSRLVYYRFGLGLPLARIGALLAAEGAEFAQGSLVGSLDRVLELLAPLAQAIRSHNGTDSHLHADETSWRVFVAVEGKTNHRHWLWVFVGQDSVAFYIKAFRNRDVVIDHLGLVRDDSGRLVLPDGRELLLSSDFYSAYQSLGADVEGLINLWCWAHMRRYFVRSGDGHANCRAWAQGWVERIKELYVAWHAWCAAEEGSGESAALWDCRRIVNEMDEARKADACDEMLPAPARKVLATLDHEWRGLTAFLEHGPLDIDNNVSERNLRRAVVLRKGCYGSRSLRAAQLAADAWSIIETTRLKGWNPPSLSSRASLGQAARPADPSKEQSSRPSWAGRRATRTRIDSGGLRREHGQVLRARLQTRRTRAAPRPVR